MNKMNIRKIIREEIVLLKEDLETYNLMGYKKLPDEEKKIIDQIVDKLISKTKLYKRKGEIKFPFYSEPMRWDLGYWKRYGFGQPFFNFIDSYLEDNNIEFKSPILNNMVNLNFMGPRQLTPHEMVKYIYLNKI